MVASTPSPTGDVVPPFQPRRLGKYRLLAPLAEGGMARVFIAQRDGATEVCVLKQMFEDFADNPVAVSRFLREAHVSSLLVHPRIGRVIDAGYEDGSFCIVMNLIVGKDIESMMHALMRQRLLVPHPVSLTAIVGCG